MRDPYSPVLYIEGFVIRVIHKVAFTWKGGDELYFLKKAFLVVLVDPFKVKLLRFRSYAFALIKITEKFVFSKTLRNNLKLLLTLFFGVFKHHDQV